MGEFGVGKVHAIKLSDESDNLYVFRRHLNAAFPEDKVSGPDKFNLNFAEYETPDEKLTLLSKIIERLI